MKHHLIARTDEHGTVYTCTLCGVVFSETFSARTIQAETCPGALPDHILDLVEQSENLLALMDHTFRLPSHEDCATKGTRLIEQWEQERGRQ